MGDPIQEVFDWTRVFLTTVILVVVTIIILAAIHQIADERTREMIEFFFRVLPLLIPSGVGIVLVIVAIIRYYAPGNGGL